MKKLITITLAALLLASCTKQKDIVEDVQKVTYEIECKYCLVYVEDNVWNRTIENERGKNQYFNVAGKWTYEFINTKLDSVKARIYIGTLGTGQNVKVTIKESKYGKQASFDGWLGYDKDPFKEGVFEKDIHLRLKP